MRKRRRHQNGLEAVVGLAEYTAGLRFFCVHTSGLPSGKG